MTANEIRSIIEKEEYECYGIRVDSTIKYNVGDTCYNSHQWWQDYPGEESGLEYNEEVGMWDGGELPGTCALQVAPDSYKYYGDNVTLIAGNSFECGNDYGEIIIEDAKVLAIVK